MRTLIVLLLVNCYSIAFCQTNLVQNGDFETHNGTVDCDYFDRQDGQNAFEDYWAQTPPWTGPEKKSLCVQSGSVGSSDHYCTGGNFGPTHAFMHNREYITAPLASSLISGKTYYVEFYVKNGGSGSVYLDNAGMRFSNDRPKQCGYYALNIDGDPHVEIDNNILIYGNAWTKITSYYTPDQDYSWLTIGTFNKDVDEQQTFRIDDIKIVEWVDDCPAIQLLENWNYTGLAGITIKADDKLYAGYDVGASSANGNVVVPAGSDISFKAGNEVGLFDGFAAELDCEFHAYNAPCGSDCFTPAPFAGASQVLCDGIPIQIGDDPVTGYNYTWTSNPANATQYLSSTTISNPVFTPPAGEGDVTYFLSATNTCGQTGSNSMSIHYDDSPSSIAQFSLSNVQLGDVPSFDAILNPDIESVYIEILDASLNVVYYQESFVNQIDFTCCQMQWEFGSSLTPCIDYKIRITVTNYCTGATATQILDWNRNRVFSLTEPIPNIITPNGSGVNDFFCVSFTGAVQITFEVKDRDGVTVYYTNTAVAPPSACIWNGDCNQGLPTCVNGPLNDGTYFYALRFYDCSNAFYDYSSFVTINHGGDRLLDTLDYSDHNEFLVFPNPSSGLISISVPMVDSGSIVIYNSLGQIVRTSNFQTAAYLIQFDMSEEPAGIYSACLFSNEWRKSLTFVVSH